MTERLTLGDLLALVDDLGVGPVRDLGLLESLVRNDPLASDPDERAVACGAVEPCAGQPSAVSGRRGDRRLRASLSVGNVSSTGSCS